MFFIGLSAGLVAMYKLIGDKIEINIKKIKTKKGTSDVTIPINVETSKTPRQLKRDERKQARIIKRNAKKAERAADKLEKKS